MKKAVFLGLLLLWTLSAGALEKQAKTEPVGKIVFAKGDATVFRVEGDQVKSLTNITFNDDIYALDTLQTKKGEMKVLFADQTVLSLGENSKVIITEQIYKPRQGLRKSIFDILKGKVRAVVEKIPNEKESDVLLRTPTAVAGIRGTDVGILANEKETIYLCFEGLIETWFLGAPDKKVFVPKGMMTWIKNGPPTTPKPIDEETKKKFRFSYLIKDILDQDGMEYLALGKDPNRGSKQDGIQQGQGRFTGPVKQRMVESLILSPLLPGGQTSTPAGLAPETAGGTDTGQTTGTPAAPTPTPPAPSPEPPPPPPPPTDRPVHLPLGFPLPG